MTPAFSIRAPADRPLKVAVIGGGLMGRRHARIYAGMNGVELVGVAEINHEAARGLAGTLACPIVADWRELLAYPGLDAVSICLPDNLHLAASQAALQRGLGVLLEKPVATDVAQAEQIAEAARGGKLLCGHMLRFDARYQMARRAFREGRIGDVVHLTTHRNSAIGAAARYGDTTSLVWHVGVHDIDLMQWMVSGRIAEVAAHGVSKRLREYGQYDSVLVLGRFAEGTPFTMELSWILPGYFGNALDGRLDLVGTGGRISVHGMDQGLRIADGDRLTFPDTARWVQYDDGGAGGILGVEIAHFVDCIRHGKPFAVPVEDAVAAVRVAAAIEKSLQDGGPVAVE